MPSGMPAPYRADLAAIHAAGFTAVARDAARYVCERLAPRARVVDLGCGDGTTAAILVEQGHSVHGIDLSPDLVAMARRRAPAATFTVGSAARARLPEDCDAILAVGEVLGYLFEPGDGDELLDRVLGRCARALRPGGLLLFDLAGAGRVRAGGERTWLEGEGWLVAVDARAAGRRLSRRIVSFRDRGDRLYRRSEETHEQWLHEPAAVLERLHTAGFAGRALPGGYGETALPSGVTAFAGTAGCVRPGD